MQTLKRRNWRLKFTELKRKVVKLYCGEITTNSSHRNIFLHTFTQHEHMRF